MRYDSSEWEWGAGYCRVHRGQGLPCPRCIAERHPSLRDAELDARWNEIYERRNTLPVSIGES